MFRAQYPECIGERFLARHILRFSDPGRIRPPMSSSSYDRLVELVDSEMSSTSSDTETPHKHAFGAHINMYQRTEQTLERIYAPFPIYIGSSSRWKGGYRYPCSVPPFAPLTCISCNELADDLCKFHGSA